MTKKKPDYTQFMKSPSPLNMAGPSDEEDHPHLNPSASNTRPSEEDIPWGEVILEPDPGQQRKLEPSPVPMSNVPAASSRTRAVGPPQPSMAARERVLARTVPVKTDDARHESDSPHATAVLDEFVPSGYPPIAVMVIGLAMVLLLLFLTGRN